MDFLPPISQNSAVALEGLLPVTRPAIESDTGTSIVSAAAPTSSFGSLVSEGLDRVNGQLVESQQNLQRLAIGDAQNLHQVMIQLEETRISFQLMMQVRNRLLEAYQDIMKMPI